jgi:hypothetical protein
MDTGLQAIQEPSFPLCYRCYRISDLRLRWYPRHVLRHRRDERTETFPAISRFRSDHPHCHLSRMCQRSEPIHPKLTRQVVGIVVYRYCGSYVSNPALGSAGVLMKKVCYGLALPGVLLSTVLITHVSTSVISETHG